MCKKCVGLMVLLGVVVCTMNVAQAQLITGIERRGSTNTPPQVAPDPLAENAVCYVDRVHEYTDIPEFLLGAEYVMVANDDKNPAGYELDVTLSNNAILYLILDNRLGGGSMAAPGPVGDPMPWVLEMGFVNLEVDLGIDEGADGTINQRSSIWALEVRKGTITLFEQNDGGSRNMYGVAALPSTPAGLASAPAPEDETSDVPREVVLSWTAGEFAATHDVYLGMSFNDVNDASRADPRDVLVSEGQTATSYDPPDLLEFGETYYWRVDEVNAAPDNTIFKGEVWSFTTEPFAYAIQNVTATASNSSADTAPENTVNGSGLNEDDQHSTAASDMWLTAADAERPVWIQYEFDRVRKLHEMLVWNYNVQFEPVLGFGLKDVTVEYSIDGDEWVLLGDVEFAQATARSDYVANTVVDFEGIAAKFVRLTINSGYGPMGQFGLSEVRFLYIPAQAREPQPNDGANDVDPEVVLAWRAGRDATSHDVYLGTDAEELPLVDSVVGTSLVPDELTFGTTYYWQVDAISDEVWAGDLWSFTTLEYRLIDGFEDYTDDIDAGEAIFDTWLDGWVNDSGSTVGYFDAPFAEQAIVRSGSQAMPLFYDNTESPFYSETERTFDSTQDWTANGADTLRLFAAGVGAPFVETAEDTVLITGGGADIWETADEFRYVYKSLSGDGSMTVRVLDNGSGTNAWAKGGPMIRQSLDAGAINVMGAVTGGEGGGGTFQWRSEASAASESNRTLTGIAPPYWVRLTRQGNTFTVEMSADGEQWEQQGAAPIDIAMQDPVLIGLAVTSHAAGELRTYEFDNISTTGNVTGDWEVADVGVDQDQGNDPAPFYVALEDAAGKVAVASHPDLVIRGGWNEWAIPLSDFAGINTSRIRTIYIGVGDRNAPTAGGTGVVYIDDIGFGRPVGQ